MVRRLRTQLLALPGVVESDDVFREDGDAFWCNGTEFAYFDGDGALALRLGRRVYAAHRAELKHDVRLRRHAPSSDWFAVTVDRPADVEFAFGLAAKAIDALLPPNGRTPKPPPVGADLARRRRFH